MADFALVNGRLYAERRLALQAAYLVPLGYQGRLLHFLVVYVLAAAKFMLALAVGRGRHVVYAHLAGLGRLSLLLASMLVLRLIATGLAAGRRVKSTLLRLMHLLPHEAAQHRP